MKGDTVLSTSASLGRIARVAEEAAGAIPYTGIIRMRPASADLDSDYIQFVLADPAFQAQVVAMGSGSVMQHFGPTHLRTMTLRIPPLGEQRAIAELLGALDGKIESNGRVAAGLAAAFAATWGRSTAQGACTVPLDEIAERVRLPGTPEANYIGLDDMPRASTVLHEWKTSDHAPKGGSWAFESGDILFGKLRPYFKRLGSLP